MDVMTKATKVTWALFLFCLFVGLAGTVQAAEDPAGKWESYAKDRYGVEYFYEKETMEHPSDTLMKVWRRRTFPPKSAQQEILNLDEIDCVKQQYRSVETRVKYKDNTSETFKKASPWIGIFTGMTEVFFIEDYCK
jgi:hypothetical protein